VPPGGPLTRSNPTPLAPSRYITGAHWLSGRYDPPSNQWGDILPTVWSDDGSTYVLMDDGGTDVPLAGGFWRQSFAKITGAPPYLRFKRVATAATPKPTTWAQVGGNPDNDDGPLGPFYSIGFAEAGAGRYFDDAGFPVGEGWDEIAFPAVSDEHAYALEVSGQSMEPAYRDGDVILVSPSAPIRRNDRVVVKTKGGEVMAKELKRRTAKTIELKSLNAAHPDRTLAAADVLWIARILWASQ